MRDKCCGCQALSKTGRVISIGRFGPDQGVEQLRGYDKVGTERSECGRPIYFDSLLICYMKENQNLK